MVRPHPFTYQPEPPETNNTANAHVAEQQTADDAAAQEKRPPNGARPSFPADTTIAKWAADERSPERAALEAAGWSFGTIDLRNGHDTRRRPYYGVIERTVDYPLAPAGKAARKTAPTARGNFEDPCSPRSAATVENHYGQPIADSDSGGGPRLSQAIDEPYGDAGDADAAALAALPPYGSFGYGVQRPEDLGSWTEIESIRQMREGCGDGLVVAVDTEYFQHDDGRDILTLQFAFRDPFTGKLREAVFYSIDGRRLRLPVALSWLVERYGLYDMDCCPFGKSGFSYTSTRRWEVPVEAGGKVKKRRFASQQDAIDATCDDEARDFLRSKHYDYRLRRGKDGKPRDPAGYVNDYRDAEKQALSVTVLFHSAKNDLSAFLVDQFDTDTMTRVTQVQGGFVSLRDIQIHPSRCSNRDYFYPLRLAIRDTMAFAPEGAKSLEKLGEAVGLPKIDVAETTAMGRSYAERIVSGEPDVDPDTKLPLGVGEYVMRHMDALLASEPVEYMEYAITDSVVTLAYASELWGYNSQMPVTVTAAAAKVAKNAIMEELGCTSDEYDAMFRGVEDDPMRSGLIKAGNRLVYAAVDRYRPVHQEAELIQRAAANAYHGGDNECDGPAYHGRRLDAGGSELPRIETYDYDLKNAYPTAMALIPDIDWLGLGGKAIEREWHPGTELTLADVPSPLLPIFGYVEFDFHGGSYYPCIPENVEGSLIFPDTSEHRDGVYSSAPEIYLALKQGATVKVAKHGRVYRAAVLRKADGGVCRSLLRVVWRLVNDRKLAIEVYEKGSLPDLLLKIAVNSIYGKLAQSIVGKRAWDAFLEEMTDMGGSAITSPAHACLATGIVRAVLRAAAQQLAELGYHVFSITTDGFISDAPPEVVYGLDLYGLADLLRAARVSLTGDPKTWEMKHAQDDLLNGSTRLNVSLYVDEFSPFDCRLDDPDELLSGVCAHNSFVTGEIKDSYEDRLTMQLKYLSRVGKVECKTKRFPGLRELASRKDRQDFVVTVETRHLSFDFDCKRKPVFDSMRTERPIIDGIPDSFREKHPGLVKDEYELARFTSEPYHDVKEYQLYKRAARWCAENGCLRTEHDWDRFKAKLAEYEKEGRAGGMHLRDLDWKIIMSCVRGWRYHGWHIPFLDASHKVETKIAFIQAFNESSREFNRNAWDNCSRTRDQAKILPYELCEAKLDEMAAAGDKMPR